MGHLVQSQSNKSLRMAMREQDASPGRNGIGEEQGTAGLDDTTELEVERPMESRTRHCLICRSPFPSAWAGERICRHCKSKAGWRNGVVRS